MNRIRKAVKFIKKNKLYPRVSVVNSPHDTEILVNNKKVILFASNNYLGMINDKEVLKAAEIGLKKWGIGSGSARLLTGNLDIHLELEKKIADFKGKEAALTFVSGYMVNSGCIPAIVNVLSTSVINEIKPRRKEPDTVIFSDEYNHASAIIGIKLSGAKKEIYIHNDMVDLENKISKYPRKKRKLIVTDGVFSMNGDIVDLPSLVKIAKRYNAMIYLDDAHAAGILGPNGRGTEDYFNLEGSCDFVMGTFTKAFGGVGGYIVGDNDLIDYLKISANSFIFTAPIAPPVVAGLIKSIEIVRKDSWRREKLLDNADYLRNGLKKIGFNTLESQTQIIPVLIGNEKKAEKIGEKLLDSGYYVPIARWPAVPKKMARLRITAMHKHTKKQIDGLLSVMEEIKKTEKL